MSVFNYYKSFINQINETKYVDKDIGQFLILSDSATKKDLCNKIFKLLINETYIYYNRLTADRQDKFNNFIEQNYSEQDFNYPKEGVYNSNPFTGGRLYVNSDLNNIEDFFCLINEYDWQVYLDDNYDVIINPYGGVSTETYYDVGLEIINQFVDDIDNQFNDCLLCCDKFYNLSKCFILYKMAQILQSDGKEKEAAFCLKYIACILKTTDGYINETVEYEVEAYTTDSYEQSQVEFPKEPWNPEPPPPDWPWIEPEPEPDPEPDPDVYEDNIVLYVLVSSEDMFCIFNDGEHYTATLDNGELKLDNLYNTYNVRRDNNDNIILY